MEIASTTIQQMVRAIERTVDNMNVAKATLLRKNPSFNVKKIDRDIEDLCMIGGFLISLYEEACLNYDKSGDRAEVDFNVVSEKSPSTFNGWLKEFLSRAGTPPEPPKEKNNGR